MSVFGSKVVNKENIKEALAIQGINLDDELKEAARKVSRNIDKAGSDRVQAMTKIKQWQHNLKIAKQNGKTSTEVYKTIKSMI